MAFDNDNDNERLNPELDVLRTPYREARRIVVEAFELRYVRALLTASGGNVSAAARLGQMDRTYLLKLIRRHHLSTR